MIHTLNTILALAVIVVVIFIVRFIRKQNVSNNTEGNSPPEIPNRENELPKGVVLDFHPVETRNSVIQVLETSYVMATSPNIDTIIGRKDFLYERLEYLFWQKTNDRYNTSAQEAVDYYKQIYYDRKLHDWQIGMVLGETHIDSEHFSAECLYEGFMRHYKRQKKEIAGLKQSRAIANRYKKLLEVYSYFTENFDIAWQSATANTFKMEKMEGLEKIKDDIKSNIKELKS